MRCLPSVRPTKNATVSSAKTVNSTATIASRPNSGISRSRIRHASPPITQATPSNVGAIAAVNDGRASEKPNTTNANEERREEPAEQPGDAAELHAEERRDEPGVAAEPSGRSTRPIAYSSWSATRPPTSASPQSHQPPS